MKVGMWSDSVNFPSLPLMKLSAYHKARGDSVEMISAGGCYDLAYVSKVFNLPLVRKIPHQPPMFCADRIVEGGTGCAISVENGKEVFHDKRHGCLPDDVEHIYPDYGLYPEYANTAYGFLTRGCPNACGFCIVSKKEGRTSRQVADIDGFWRGQKNITLLDPNILACRNRDALLRVLEQAKARINFCQGLDARFIDDSVVDRLNRIHVDRIHFAFDLMENERSIIQGLRQFGARYEKSTRKIRVYVLTNYNTSYEEDWYRVRKIRECGLHPYIMIYQKGTQGRFLTDLAGWCNNMFIGNSIDFHEYVPRKDGRNCGQLYGRIIG